jgi:hypothetical protein
LVCVRVNNKKDDKDAIVIRSACRHLGHPTRLL